MRRRLVPVLQTDSADCGYACLAMILTYHGRPVQLANLRGSNDALRGGTSAFLLAALARAHGLECHGVEMSSEEVPGLPLPAILFWRRRHFVVLEAVTSRWAQIVDPATGRRRITREHFDQAFSGVALLFEGYGSRQLEVMLEALGRGARWVLRHPSRIATAGLTAAVALVVPLILSLVSAEELGSGGMLPLVLAALLVLSAFGRVLVDFLALRRASDKRIALYRAAREADLRALAASSTADPAATAKLFARIGRGEIAVGDAEALVLTSATQIAACALLLFYLDPLLATLGLVLTAAGAAVRNGLAQSRDVFGSQARSSLGRLQEESRLMGSRAWSRNSRVEKEAIRSRLRVLSDRLSEAVWHDRAREAVFATASQGFGWTAPGVILLLCISAVAAGRLSVAAAAAAFLAWLLLDAYCATLQIAWRRGDHAGSEALQAALSMDVSPGDAEPLQESLPGSSFRGQIELVGVDFNYSPSSGFALRDISLKVEPGQLAAIAGRSASGRSTVARLCSGSLTPCAGSVLFDGLPVDQWQSDRLFLRIALVSAHSTVMTGTLFENVTLGNPSITEDDVRWACSVSTLDHDLPALRLGWHTPLGEGSAWLTAGQRQKLELARVLVARPALLVLDEATTLLDSESERQIHDRLELAGITRIVVTSRPELLQRADLVLSLGAGRTPVIQPVKQAASESPASAITPKSTT